MTSPVDNDTFMELYRGHHLWPVGRRYRIIKPLTITSKTAGDEFTIRVQPGYSWDGPTKIPVLRPASSLMLYASIFHDAFYKSTEGRPYKQGLWRIWRNGEPITEWTREQADTAFRNLLIAHGMWRPVAVVVGWVVEKFGAKFGWGDSFAP